MTTPSPSSLTAAVVAAWQSALAAEHAAIFGYGAVGPKLPAADQAQARRFEATHLTARDAVSTAMRSAGLDPVRSRSTYPLPTVVTPGGALRVALGLEEATAAAWRYLVAVAARDDASPSLRSTAVAALQAAAVRATSWRALVRPSAPFTPFPGI